MVIISMRPILLLMVLSSCLASASIFDNPTAAESVVVGNIIRESSQPETISLISADDEEEPVEETLDNYDPDEGSGNWFYIPLIAVLGVIVVSLFLVIQHPKHDPRMENYVMLNLKRGYTREQIKKELVREGFNAKNIDAVFKRIR